MLDANIVEIQRRSSPEAIKSFGSGYLITASHVLTARHVVLDRDGGPSDSDGLRLRVLGGQWVEARSIAWESQTLDIAIVELREPHEATTVLPEFGVLLPTEARIKWRAVGFPRASASKDEKGTVRDTFAAWGTIAVGSGMKSRFQPINLAGDSTPPRSHELWAGMSGAAVFAKHDGNHFLVGVITTTPRTLTTGALEYSPIADAWDKPSFPSTIFAAPGKFLHSVGVGSTDLNSARVQEMLYLANHKDQRRPAADAITNGLRRSPGSPVILAINGVPDDDIDLLVDRFRFQLLPMGFRATPRSSYRSKNIQHEVRVGLIAMPRSGTLEDRLDKMLDDLDSTVSTSDDARLKDFEGDDAVLTETAARLNRCGVSRTFCTYISASNFDQEQASVLSAWLGWWEALSEKPLTHTPFYILCFVHNEIALPSLWGRLNPFRSGPVDLRRFVGTMLVEGSTTKMEIVDLGDLQPLDWREDIKTWLEDEDLHRGLGINAKRARVLQQQIRTKYYAAQEAGQASGPTRMRHLHQLIDECKF